MLESCACCSSLTDTTPHHDFDSESALLTGEGYFTPELPACSACLEDDYPGSDKHRNEGASLFRFFITTPIFLMVMFTVMFMQARRRRVLFQRAQQQREGVHTRDLPPGMAMLHVPRGAGPPGRPSGGFNGGDRVHAGGGGFLFMGVGSGAENVAHAVEMSPCASGENGQRARGPMPGLPVAQPATLPGPPTTLQYPPANAATAEP